MALYDPICSVTLLSAHNIMSILTWKAEMSQETLCEKAGNDHFKRIGQDFFCIFHIEHVIINPKN